MLYSSYPYINFRFEDSEEINGVKDIKELYDLETEELPLSLFSVKYKYKELQK